MVVVGVGLRTLPPMAAHFERLINVLHDKAPRTKLAFNSKPDDSDAAAQRLLMKAVPSLTVDRMASRLDRLLEPRAVD